jgi:ABC-type uncharacterized transport system permease subunit
LTAPVAASGGSRLRALTGRVWSIIALPLVSFALAILVGAIIILASEAVVPGQAFDPTLPITAYRALLVGAFGNESSVVSTLVSTTPLVFGGLSVALGFKAGLFNIGAQGQFLIGALGSVFVGVIVSSQPPLVAIPLALLAGLIGGAIWGCIPGMLKALTGAHEVVVTIMLNYVAIGTVAALVSGPLKIPASVSPVTFDVGNAALPIIIGKTGHLGIVLALVCVGLLWWLLYRTTWGFEIRAVGANPNAARYAGMRPRAITALTMTACGALAGLAGASVLLGVTHSMSSAFGTTVGFDSISVALLARSNPVAIVFTALLFGAMRAGAGLMQIQAQIPAELVDVLQGTILLFLIMGPVLRSLFRLRSATTDIGGARTSIGQAPAGEQGQ